MNTTITSIALTERIARVQGDIDRAAEKSGRSSDEITLVAVSKTVGRATVDEAYAAGLRHFGENRVQDSMHKFEIPLPAGVELSMIGQLQSNKARHAVRLFQRVESVDRMSLIEALDHQAATANIVLPVLLQVNVAGEGQKAGCSRTDALDLARDLAQRDHLRFDGLMTIAPLVDDPEEVRTVFRELRLLRDGLQEYLPQVDLGTLSMGMTNDFEVAIEEGATRVRIGRAVFG